MSLLAYNLYRQIASLLESFKYAIALTLFQKFIANHAEVLIPKEEIQVHLKKKRNLPLLLETMNEFKEVTYSFLKHKKIQFLELHIPSKIRAIFCRGNR